MLNLHKLKLVIFDCDGVLFDSFNANKHFYNKIAQMAGRSKLDSRELAYCHMHTAEESIRYIFRNDLNLLEAAFECYKDLDYQDFLHYMEMEPEMVETVRLLGTRYHTAISTNRSTTMPRLREIYGLDDVFDVIVCALDVDIPKPDPEGVFKILRLFDLRPENAVYIGDSMVDQEVAMRAGVPFLAYKNRKLDAVFHVERFGELSALLMDEDIEGDD